MNIFLKDRNKIYDKNMKLCLKQVKQFILTGRNMSTIDTIFIVRNMKCNLNNEINFGLQLVNYITHVLVLQLFKIVLHRLNYYFALLEYKHKFCKTS